MDLSSETMQAGKEWENIFKLLSGKQFQPRILYPARLSFIWEKKTKTFSDKQNLKEFTSTSPALQDVLKGVLSWTHRNKSTKNNQENGQPNGRKNSRKINKVEC